MCGLAGYLWTHDQRPWHADAVLRRMSGCLRHRGPDSEGTISESFVEAAFQRLAIVDLETGDQPATTSDGAVQVLCNGEIYNHAVLRSMLERKGYRFKTRSDTEVIPALYREFGLAFPKYLNGMFAICVVDRAARRVVLVRDRLGIKPLYVARRPDGLLFASELKSLLSSGLIDRRIDPTAVAASLNFFYTPGPSTLVEGVDKLMPGHMIVAGADGSWNHHRWYTLPAASATQAGRPDYDQLQDLLHDSIRLRTEADVPVGIGLSGGIDSSVLAMYAADNASHPVTAFTSVCSDSPPDELPAARSVARQLGMRHIVVPSRTDGFMNEIAAMVWFADEPNTDPAFYPSAKLAEAAAQSVKVLLTGAGEDEIFGGYRHYRFPWHHHAWSLVPASLRRSAQAMIGPRHRLFERLNIAGELRRGRLSAHARAMSNLSTRERAMLCSRCLSCQDPIANLAAAFDESAACDVLNQQLYADVHTYLPEQVLTMLDRSTMSASIEGRVPFLDHRLVEALFGIHGRFKIAPPSWRRRLRDKHVLRTLAGDRLPVAVRTRRKSGYPSPVFRWLGEELAPVLRHAVGRERSITGQFLPEDWVRGMCASPQSIAQNVTRLYPLFILEIWNELFINRMTEHVPTLSLHDLFEITRRPQQRRAA